MASKTSRGQKEGEYSIGYFKILHQKRHTDARRHEVKNREGTVSRLNEVHRNESIICVIIDVSKISHLALCPEYYQLLVNVHDFTYIIVLITGS